MCVLVCVTHTGHKLVCVFVVLTHSLTGPTGSLSAPLKELGRVGCAGAGHVDSRLMFHWCSWSPASARTSFRFLAEENLQTGQTHQCCDIVSEDGVIPKGEACAAAVLWLAQPPRTRGAQGLQHDLIFRFGIW